MFLTSNCALCMFVDNFRKIAGSETTIPERKIWASYIMPRPMSRQSATLVRNLTRRLRRKKIGKVAQMMSVMMERTKVCWSARTLWYGLRVKTKDLLPCARTMCMTCSSLRHFAPSTLTFQYAFSGRHTPMNKNNDTALNNERNAIKPYRASLNGRPSTIRRRKRQMDTLVRAKVTIVCTQSAQERAWKFRFWLKVRKNEWRPNPPTITAAVIKPTPIRVVNYDMVNAVPQRVVGYQDCSLPWQCTWYGHPIPSYASNGRVPRPSNPSKQRRRERGPSTRTRLPIPG